MTLPSPAMQLLDYEAEGSTPLSVGAQRSVADFVHVAANHNLALADRKAGIVLTLVSATILFQLERNGLSPMRAWPAPLALVWLFMMLSLAVSAATAFAAVIPRVIQEPDDIYLWAAIGRHAHASSWTTRLRGYNETDLTGVRLQHCHALARICVAKFRLLRISMISAASGLLGAALFSIL
ncbi:MAG: DUF5706 domain-containing protein [Kiloniellaceae bacterium]